MISTRTETFRTHQQLSTWKNRRLQSKNMEHLLRRKEGWELGLSITGGLQVTPPNIVAVGGGKGGVGKSVISANLAGRLGQMGFNVLLVDLDFGSSNLHTYLGTGIPKQSLAQVLLNGSCSFEDAIMKTQVPGVWLLAGGQDESWSQALEERTSFFQSLWPALIGSKAQNIDFLVLDLGAGTHRHTMDFFIAAHLGIVTVLPEPTSIENAYAFLKTTLWRLMENVGRHQGDEKTAQEIRKRVFESGALNESYVVKLQRLEGDHPRLIQSIFRTLSHRTTGFVVNQIRSQKDIDVAHSMETICRHYFGFHTTALGYLNYDDAAWKALRNRRLLVTDFPHALISKRMTQIANHALESLGFQ